MKAASLRVDVVEFCCGGLVWIENFNNPPFLEKKLSSITTI